MHQQIGVAANGAGEVHITFQTQTKMACVIRAVNRLLHTAQYQLLIEPTSLLGRYIPQQGLIGLGTGDAFRKPKPNGHQVLLQGLKLEDVRGFVQAIQRPTVVGLDKSRRTHVGIDHGFFDDLMRLQARHFVNTGHMALLYVDNALAAIKIQSAPLILGFTKRGMNVGKSRNRSIDRLTILLSTGQWRGIIQMSLHLFIRQSAVRANQRIVEGVGAHDTFFRHLHITDQGESKNVRF